MSPSAFSSRDRAGARRLDRVANLQGRAGHAVPADLDGAVAAPDRDVVAVDQAAHADSCLGAEGRDGRQLAGLGARRVGRPPARRGARTRPRPRRRGAAPRPGWRRSSRRTPASSSFPSVTVPVLSSTIVSIRRARSSTSGPLIRTPSCAPRPVPTMSATGVASPSAHGQAMISTDTAAVKASAAEPPNASQPASVSSERTITTGTKIAEMRSASRCASALPDWASSTSRAIWASAVSAPTRVARTARRPYVLIVAPATLAPAATSTGTGSPVSSDWSTADSPSTTTPSVAIFSPGWTTKTSPTRSSATGMSTSSPSRRTRASFAPSSRSLRMAADARALARASRYRPSRISVVTTAATSK